MPSVVDPGGLIPIGRMRTGDAFDRWWIAVLPDENDLYRFGIDRLTAAHQAAITAEKSGRATGLSASEIEQRIQECEAGGESRRWLIENQVFVEKSDGGIRAFCSVLSSGQVIVRKMVGELEMQIDPRVWIGYEAQLSIQAGRDYRTQESLFCDAMEFEAWLKGAAAKRSSSTLEMPSLQKWFSDEYAPGCDRQGLRPSEEVRLKDARLKFGPTVTRSHIRALVTPDAWKRGRPKK